MATEMIENHPYDEIRVGQTAELQRTLTRDDIVLFGKVSGDLNPTHVDVDYARQRHRDGYGSQPVEQRADFEPAGQPVAGARHRLSEAGHGIPSPHRAG